MRTIATGTAKAPATCGELIQGTINGLNFLVTCPVNIFSIVTVAINSSGKMISNRKLPKIQQAVAKTLAELNMRKLGAEIRVNSQIPYGKGMASSTADIAAACAATANALGVSLTPRMIADIALSIEPSDGLMFPGVVMFDHISGKFCRTLGKAPDVEIVIVDLGGTVDTVAFNKDRNLECLNIKKEQSVHQALLKLESAFIKNDLGLFGKAITESAFAHQFILHKPKLTILSEICAKTGGIGINIAHSGTIVGLFFKSGHLKSSHLTSRYLFDLLLKEGFNNFCKTELTNRGIEVLQKGAGERFWVPLNERMEEIYQKQRKRMV